MKTTQTLKNLRAIFLSTSTQTQKVLENAMLAIYAFLDLSFELGINPLEQLRKILPEFEWSYRDMMSSEEMREDYPGANDEKFVRQQDLIWDRGECLVGAKYKQGIGGKLTFNMSHQAIEDASWQNQFTHLSVRSEGDFLGTAPEKMLTVLSAEITEYHC